METHITVCVLENSTRYAVVIKITLKAIKSY